MASRLAIDSYKLALTKSTTESLSIVARDVVPELAVVILKGRVRVSDFLDAVLRHGGTIDDAVYVAIAATVSASMANGPPRDQATSTLRRWTRPARLRG